MNVDKNPQLLCIRP